MENSIDFKEPWYKTDQDLKDQLKREVSKKHILYKKDVKTIARRQDNDDVLFQITNLTNTYALVHLTWSQKVQKDPNYPTTIIYNTIKELKDKIELDIQDWE
jgi:hypothetical protein